MIHGCEEKPRKTCADISRRGFVRLTLASVGSAAAALSRPACALADEAQDVDASSGSGYPEEFKIAILSDIHYMSHTHFGENHDFEMAENSDRKMFRESADILHAALREVVDAEPDLVIVCGDLTKDGEYVCHKEVHDLFAAAREELKARGKATRFQVINGNHDINNDDDGRDFSSGSAQHLGDAGLTTPEKFKELCSDCGYSDAVAKYDEAGHDGGSLSYVTRPAKGFTLISVDSCKYSPDQNGLGRYEHVTSGIIRQPLLSWVCEQAKAGRERGDVVLVMQHHGVVPHFTMEPTVMAEYLVDNYEEVAAAYAEAGVSAVFTGHMHANDIASKDYGGKTVYDIETCATVTYPSDIRMAKLGFAEVSGQLAATLDLQSHALGSVEFSGLGDSAAASIEDISEYGHDRLLTIPVVETMVCDVVLAPELAKMTTRDALKGTLGSLLKTDASGLNKALFSALAGSLPTDAAHGAVVLDLESLKQKPEVAQYAYKLFGKLVAWYDPSNASLNIDQMSLDELAKPEEATALVELTDEDVADLAAQLSEEPAEISEEAPNKVKKYFEDLGDKIRRDWTLHYCITADSFDVFADKLFDQVVKVGINQHTAEVVNLARAAILALLTAPLDVCDGQLFDVVKYAYGTHLYGDEEEHKDEELEKAVAAIAENAGDSDNDGSIASMLRYVLSCDFEAGEDKNVQGWLATVANYFTFDLKDLVIANGSMLSKTVLDIVAGLVGGTGDILRLVGVEKLPSLVGDIPQLREFAGGLLVSLTNDPGQADRRGELTTSIDSAPGGASSGEGDQGQQGGSGQSGQAQHGGADQNGQSQGGQQGNDQKSDPAAPSAEGLVMRWVYSDKKYARSRVSSDPSWYKAHLWQDGVLKDDHVRYLFTGFTSKARFYSSASAPTEPGSYLETASAHGVDGFLFPQTRAFRIVK